VGWDKWWGESLDGAQFETFTTQDGLANNVVGSLLEDREGALWVGTQGGGISRYDQAQMAVFTTRDGLPSNGVTGLEDRHGQLWVGTAKGVSCWDGTRFTAVEALAGKDVLRLLEDRQGQVWFGTNGAGVIRYDGETFVSFTTQDGLGENWVSALLEDRKGYLWFGTFGGGLSRYDGRVFQHLSRKDGLALDVVHQIIQDRDGAIWIATEGGLTRYRPGSTPPGIRLTQVMADRSYGPVETLALSASQQGSGSSLRARA
jgi:ligand-binding sensor domain-containing protein